MIAVEESNWIKRTANELNNLLQVISDASEAIEAACEIKESEASKYLVMLQSAVERAAKVAQMMAARVGGQPTGMVEPAAPALAAKPAATAQHPLKVSNPNGPLELILIVDDEELVTFLAQRVLTEGGYRVVTARDGMEAVDIFGKAKDAISLVILDFTMPVMDGADVFDALLQIDPRASVVLSSGFAEQDRLRQMLARGLRGFIPKPYTHQKLLSQVRLTLDSIKGERSGKGRGF